MEKNMTNQAAPELLPNLAGFVGTNEQFLNALGVIASRSGADGTIAAVALEHLNRRADLAAARVSGTIKTLYERACEVVHHDHDCPAIGGNGDADCKCDAVPFLNDFEALAAIQPDPDPKPVDPISDYWDGRSAYRSATGSPHDFTAPAMPRDQLSPEARKDWLLNGAPRVWLEVDGGGPWFVKPVQPSREYLRSDLATPSSAGTVSVEAAEALKPFFGDPVMEGLLWSDATPESLVTIRVQKRVYDRARAALRALAGERG